MPKKFKGENSKATVARDRKAAERAEQLAKKEAAEEDAAWADDDKHIARKQQRKEDKEKKRVEQLERKKELAKMADEELEAIKAAKPRAAQKLTRAQIEAEQERQRQAAVTAEKEKQLVHTDQPLEDNFNRLKMEGDQAQTVEEAISVLSVSDPDLEKHPEKRMKAAFLKYEEENLPILKQENPNMRLSQLKQMLKKDWMKSPENPMNQRTAAFNEKR
ncbi:coiled-coil domain-containing protein 124-A-like isoform X2 [Mya arenaria]|uniref:coiled-coil domain-containing protein 124-A-like isoform X2 n=1 Tax=Mya arenaria TaxID=6604 RepID=UPI0022E11823|nr:coiled-coil domain-containing protein 124-A-like isoform X2 [Mya arenaria]